MAQTHPIYGRIDGPIVIIGFGSIGKGTWPLIERHFDYDADKLVVVEPDPAQANFMCKRR
jgi:homospermidine synthase